MSFKNIFLSFLLLFLVGQVQARCTYTVRLFDQAGNGSDGAQWFISINEANFHSYTIPYSANDVTTGPISGASYFDVTFESRGGTLIDVFYEGVPNSDQHAYAIYDDVGRIVQSVNLDVFQNTILGFLNQDIPSGRAFKQRVKMVCSDQTCEQDFLLDAYAAERLGSPHLEASNCSESPSNIEKSIYIPIQSFCPEEVTIGDRHVAKSDLNTFTDISLRLRQQLNSTTIDYSINFQYDARNNLIVNNAVSISPSANFVLTPIQINEKWYVRLAIPENTFLPGRLFLTSDYNYDEGSNSSTTDIEYPSQQKTDTLYVFTPQNFVSNDQVNISLDANLDCTKKVELDDLLESFEPCQIGETNLDDFFYEMCFLDINDRPIVDANGDNIAPYLDQSLSGKLIKYIITNRISGLQHCGTILIEDKQAPKINDLPDGEIPCNHPLYDSLLIGKDFSLSTFEPIEPDGSALGIIDLAANTRQIIEFDVSVCEALGIDLNCQADAANRLRQIKFKQANGDDLPFGIRLNWTDYGDNSTQNTTSKESFCETLTPYCRNWEVEIENFSSTSIAVDVVLELETAYQYHNGFVVNGQNVNGCYLSLTPELVNDCSEVTIELAASVFRTNNCSDPNTSGTIHRTFKIEDAQGMQTFVEQEIVVTKPSVAEIVEQTNLEDLTFFCSETNIEQVQNDTFGFPNWACNNIPTEAGPCGVVVTFTDGVLIPTCGSQLTGTFTRTWQVTDLCSSSIQTIDQQITVSDTSAPVLTGIDTTFTTSSTACDQTVDIGIDVDENCSDYTASLSVEYLEAITGSVSLLFDITNDAVRVTDLPINTLGPINFTIELRDGCGNISETSFSKQLRDNAAPICRIDEELSVSITASGSATVCAASVDEGTSDNCGLDRIEISLDQTNWSNCLTLACQDGATQTIYFRATDLVGNQCVQTSMVRLSDLNPPVFGAAPNYTTTCDDPNLPIIGDEYPFPSASDICGNSNVVLDSVVESAQSCAGYAFYRYFSASDGLGNDAFLIDTIFVRSNALGYSVIVPKDTTLSACQTSFTSAVQVINVDPCQEVQVTQRDSIIRGLGASCFTIIRIFEIRNECLINGNPSPNPDLGNLVGANTYQDNDGYQVDTQRIVFLDNIAPVLTGCTGDTSTISLNQACELSVSRLVSASDNCDNPTISYELFRNNVRISRAETRRFDETLEDGFYELRWTAVDDCGNFDICSEYFDIQDLVRPVCDFVSPFIAYSEESGEVVIVADSVNRNSSDNCRIDSFAIRSLTGSFAKTLEFNCINVQRRAIVQVVDAAGNTCQDTIDIIFRDSIPPLVTTTNRRTTCNDPLVASPESFPFPTVEESCSAAGITIQRVTSTQNGCGDFEIIRTFLVQDDNEFTQNQVVRDTIFVQDTSSYTVTFLRDTAGLACDFNLLAVPFIQGLGSCTEPSITITDSLLVEGACLTRLRIFEVIDSCVFQAGISSPDKGTELAPNVFMDDDGYQVDTQRITLIDTVAPTFTTCPADTIQPRLIQNVCEARFTFTYEAVDNCVDADLLQYAYSIQNSVGDLVAIGTGNEVDELLQLDTFRLNMVVTDVCGNQDSCTTIIEFIDRQNPRLTSLDSVFQLDVDGSITIMAKDLVNLEENCTPVNDLDVLFSLNPRTDTEMFNCDDLISVSMPIQRFVLTSDASGNGGFVLANFSIVDSLGYCEGSSLNVQGVVMTPDIVPLENVTLEFREFSRMATTPYEGNYKLADLAQNQFYTLELNKEALITEGISVMDILILQRNLLAIENSNDPYFDVKADLNMDGKVSFSDLNFLQQVLLTQAGEAGNHGGQWKFADYTTMDMEPTNAFRLGRLKASVSKSFMGFKLGDLTGDAYPSTKVQPRTKGKVNLLLPNKQLKAGEWAEIDIKVEKAADLAGLQMGLQMLDAEVDLEMANGLENAWGEIVSNNGLAQMAMTFPNIVSFDANAQVMTIRIKPSKNTTVADLVALNAINMEPQAITNENGVLVEKTVELVFEDVVEEGADVVLFQNRPNPFNQTTEVGFYLPEPTEVSFKVFDVNGRLVFLKEGAFTSGKHTIDFDRTTFGQEGVYYYRLETLNFSDTRKMIFTP